jgi:hypothetical protein
VACPAESLSPSSHNDDSGAPPDIEDLISGISRCVRDSTSLQWSFVMVNNSFPQDPAQV